MTTPPAANDTSADQDYAGAIAFPPYIHAGFALLGLGLEIIWPMNVLPFFWQLGLPVVLLVLVYFLGKSAAPQFRKKGTTLDVGTPTTAIITEGAYRYSRNPIYLGMALMHLAIGILIDSVWVVAMVIPAMIVMTYGVIIREESYLTRKFGDEYLGYKARVRRWL